MKLRDGTLYTVLGIGAAAAGVAFLVVLASFAVSIVAAFWPVT
jgi:hypothetical protein